MEDIDIGHFLNKYIPLHIRNKIMHYTIKSIYNRRKFLLEHKKIEIMGELYNTKTGICIYDLPLELDHIKFHRTNKIVNNQKMNRLLTITKTVTTYISENQNEMYTALGNMYSNKRTIHHAFCNVYLNLKYIKYVNKTTIDSRLTGTTMRYNNFIELIYKKKRYRRNKIVFSSVSIKELNITPLNFLWKIKNREISIAAIKSVASQNKIKGRSKLKTRQDYINVFMKL
jgi:hypothetical protein|tara:strand:+ start:601 stop:1284 length:684 start_codon:yes stop_codon:yes gene_type:complete